MKMIVTQKHGRLLLPTSLFLFITFISFTILTTASAPSTQHSFSFDPPSSINSTSVHTMTALDKFLESIRPRLEAEPQSQVILVTGNESAGEFSFFFVHVDTLN